MSQKSNHPGDDLVTGNAYFSPRFSLLNIPSLQVDPEGEVALHEMVHADTFAGTDFYALFAERVLRGEAVPINKLASFLEVLPTMYDKFGGRITPGTCPNQEVIKQLEICVLKYREFFDKIWISFGQFDPNLGISSSDQKGQISESDLFNRHILLNIFHGALELSIIGKDLSPPETFVENLYRKFDRFNGLQIPQRGQTVKDHIRVLMGFEERDMITMFIDHFRLQGILIESENSLIMKHLTLLPALIGIEFFVKWQSPRLSIIYFDHLTMSFEERIWRYVNKRLRTPVLKTRIAIYLYRLLNSLNPTENGFPILVDPEFLDDPHACNLYEFLALRSFFSTFPDFLRLLMTEHPIQDMAKRYLWRIDWFEKHSINAVDAYIREISVKLNNPEISNFSQSFRLHPGQHPNLGEVRFLKPR